MELVNNLPCLSVTCEICRGAPPQSTDERLDVLEREIREMALSMKNSISTLTDFTASGVIGDDSNGQSTSNSGERLRPISFAAAIGSSVKNCVSEALSEEIHKKNVVVSGLTEPVGDGADLSVQEAQAQDKIRITEILVSLGLPGLEPKIQRMNRGKSVPETVPRLLKLEFNTHGDQQLFLKEKSRLFKLEKWKKVFIRPSLPLAARRAELIIRKQAHQLNVDLHGDNYKDQLDGAIEKFGVRTISNVLCPVKFARESVEVPWPKKGIIVEASELPEISLN